MSGVEMVVLPHTPQADSRDENRFSKPWETLVRWTLVLMLVLCQAVSNNDAQAAELLRGLGGDAGFGTLAMGRNDDGSSALIPLGTGFPYGVNFFGNTYESLYINNNGNVTFNGRVSSYTPHPFPISNRPMIAPFWGDVDTRCAAGSPPYNNNVYYSKAIDNKFIVTWFYVGFYSCRTHRLNAFQLVLTDRSDIAPGDFDVEFRYEQMQWTTGLASGGNSNGLGGIPAQVGFDAGDRVNYYQHPDSRTAEVLELVNTSNVDQPGVWLFEIRNGIVAPPQKKELKDLTVKLTLPTTGLNIDHTTFTVAPQSVITTGDQTVVEWFYSTFAADQTEHLEFDAILIAPTPGEKRIVTANLALDYTDINGNPVHEELGPQYIEVLPSIFTLAVDTDRTSYSSNESVLIDTAISNLSEYTARTDAHIAVIDTNGTLVKDLGTVSNIALAPSESRELSVPAFFTGETYAGEYEIYVELLDETGTAVMQTSAPFNITVPSEAGVDATVATDMSEYAPFDTVHVLERIENSMPNAAADGLVTMTTIHAPDGSLFWETEASLRSLSPGAVHELSHTLPLNGAEAGLYHIELTAFDAQGLVVAFADSAFSVLSTAETGTGLVGQLGSAPDPVLRTDPVDIFAEVTNKGNDVIQGLPLTLSLVDPEGEREVASWSEVVDLPRDGTHTISERWIADLPGGTVLYAVLSAELNGQVLPLAHRTVRVEEKLVSTPATNGRGRLLVLLDPPPAAQCQAVDGLRASLLTPQQLAAEDLLIVELLDPQGNLIDAESIQDDGSLHVDNSTGARANLILTKDTEDRITIDIRSLETSTLPAGDYRLSATLYQDGLNQHFDSGALSVGCSNLSEPGTEYGDFQLLETDIRAEGPEIEQRAFLEQLLREYGWSHTVVTNASAFASELRRGGYSGYLLQSSSVHLDVQVQRELRERVFAGAGILMAGIHDQRNHHLLEVTGIKPVGVLPHVEGIHPHLDTALEAPDAIFATAETPLALQLSGATALAEYRTGKGNPHPQTAIALHDYGNGHSVIAGFDLLAQAQAAGTQSDYATFLLAALDHVHPAAITARPGISIPFLWQVHNRGDATMARLQLEIGGLRITDPGPANADGPTRLWYDLNLPHDGTDALRFWWQLPRTEDEAWIAAELSIAEGVVFSEYGSIRHSVPLDWLPDFNDVRNRIDATHAESVDYADILRELDLAEEALERSKPEQAVFELLKASDELATIGGTDADAIRVMVAWLIHGIAGQI